MAVQRFHIFLQLQFLRFFFHLFVNMYLGRKGETGMQGIKDGNAGVKS